MAAASKLRYGYLAFLSKPRNDRRLYRLVKKLKARNIVELGVDSIERSLRLISVCQRYSPDEKIGYAAFDWFDERPNDRDPLSLIEAHRQIKAAGARPRLMPGGPTEAFPATANSLLGADLVLLSPEADDEALASCWFYMPRVLRATSAVVRGQQGVDQPVVWSDLTASEIDALAQLHTARQAA